MPSSSDVEKARSSFLDLQNRISEDLLNFDPSCKPKEDVWEREEEEEALPKLFAKGDALEKGGLTFRM